MEYRNNQLYNVNDYDKCYDIVNELTDNNLRDLAYSKYKKESIPFAKLDFIGKGGEGIVYILNNNNCGHIVIKVMEKYKITHKTIFFIDQCNKLIKNNISPNFLYSYGVIKKDKYGVIMSEVATGTVENWVKNNHSDREWLSFLFQIVQGVYCMQTIMKTYHGDMKPKNILFKTLNDNNTIFKYNINGKSYYVPTYGYLFLISDFGHAQSLLLAEHKNYIKTYINSNADLEHIIDLHKRIMVSAIQKMYKINDILNIIKLNNDEYFENYFKTEKEKIQKELSKYPQAIKDKMLLRSAIYYIIEKNYIKWSDIPDEFQDMKLPSNEIILFIDSWRNKTIIDIIKSFSEFFNSDNDHNKNNGQIIEFDTKN